MKKTTIIMCWCNMEQSKIERKSERNTAEIKIKNDIKENNCKQMI